MNNILQKNYDFLRYLVPILQGIPRNQKFLIADRIQNLVMDNQELFLEAYYSAQGTTKKTALQKVNLNLEKLRFLFRLCHDLRLTDTARYEHISRLTNEIGAMTGGWLKTL